jgi:hypothetical protein
VLDIPPPYAQQNERKVRELQNEGRIRNRTFSIPCVLLVAVCLAVVVPVAQAQVTPAAGYTPPDDTPTIKVGSTIFTDYTYTVKPQAKDADGNQINPNSFNVSRAYINVTGNLSHIVAFRVTPDVFRETDPATAANGSLVFRIKYAFAQFNLDDWMTKGSWIRLGIQQTPYIDYAESIYPYRFQGTVFIEREGYTSSGDAGVSFHTAFPQNYGDVHVGIYNGEGYGKADPNDQKAVEMRGTLRPLPMNEVLRGWRVTGFYFADHYIAHAERTRALFNTTYEHKHVRAGFDYLSTYDQQAAAKPDVHGLGWSAWVTPRFGRGFEVLLRYDHNRPDVDDGLGAGNGVNKRTIAGVSYWFPHQGNVSSALLFDVDNTSFDGFTPAKPTQQRLAVHALIAF